MHSVYYLRSQHIPGLVEEVVVTFLLFSEAVLKERLVLVNSIERLSTLSAHASICVMRQVSTAGLAWQRRTCNLSESIKAALMCRIGALQVQGMQ